MRSVDGAGTYMGGGCLLREFSNGATSTRIEKVSYIALSIPRRRQVPELGAMMRWRRETVVACVDQEPD